MKADREIFTSELQDQMADAAQTTARAYVHLQHIRHLEKGDSAQGGRQSLPAEEFIGDKAKEKEKKLSAEIAIMEPILRFLQLLCENHNRDLQVSYFFWNFGKQVLLVTFEV